MPGIAYLPKSTIAPSHVRQAAGNRTRESGTDGSPVFSAVRDERFKFRQQDFPAKPENSVDFHRA